MNRFGVVGVLLVASWYGTVTAAEPASAASDAELRAVGIGVTDLARSEQFYSAVLGMQRVREYKLEAMDEIVMALPGHASPVIVLMRWHDVAERKLPEDNVKLVFNVANAAAVIDRVRAAGGRIDREAAPIDVLNGQIVGLGRDPDGYVIELIERR
jgi:lactoylglutathione lyase